MISKERWRNWSLFERFEHKGTETKENRDKKQREIMNLKSEAIYIYQYHSQKGGLQFQQRKQAEEHKDFSMKETNIL